MPKIVILTGPQGSGNHLFSKIFALHPEVLGWREQLKEFWIGHDVEPFNRYWLDPKSITPEIMQGHQYAVTSISVPYIEDGMPSIPPLLEFQEHCEAVGLDTQLVVIGRDRNILRHQQTRLRGGPTYGTMTMLLRRMDDPPLFISQELLYLYKGQYIRSLEKWIGIPTAWDSPQIEEILKQDENEKYIHAIDHHWLDETLHKVTQPHKKTTVQQ